MPVEKLTSKFALKDIDGFFEKYGKHTILIARLLPFISFDLVSYAAGLTSMNFWSFFIATGIGQLPATIVYSYYVGGMLTGGAQLLMSGLLILFALSIAIYVGKKVWNEKRGKMTNKELKKNLEDCVNCGLCYKVCPMMNTFGDSPKNILRDIDKNKISYDEIAYSCMLCNACTEACPKDINLKEMFQNLRIKSYRENLKNTSKKFNLKIVQNHQKGSFSKFLTSKNNHKKIKRVFIPGCSLRDITMKLFLK